MESHLVEVLILNVRSAGACFLYFSWINKFCHDPLNTNCISIAT